jgi:hypothetical protein
MFGFHSHLSGLRRQLRSSNRALWLRARAALTQRNADGFFVRFQKCSSHNKDPNQHLLITLWNSRADKHVKLACHAKQGCLHEWTPEGDLSFQILYRGKLVRGDPRAHIRKTMQSQLLDFAALLSDGGVLRFLVNEVPCRISLGTLHHSRSPVLLSRA